MFLFFGQQLAKFDELMAKWQEKEQEYGSKINKVC